MSLSVTVIMPTLNRASTVGAALESLFRSSRQPLEILVVDGGSSDETVEIAARFALVRVIVDPVKGIARAFNTGVAAARGDLIAFNSSDDEWTDGKLDIQCAFLEAHPEVAYVTGHALHILDGPAPANLRPDLLDGPVPAAIPETLLARRAVFEQVGPFDERFSAGNDTAWFARARDLGIKGAMLPETLLRKHIHGSNDSLGDPKLNENLLKILRESLARKRAAP